MQERLSKRTTCDGLQQQKTTQETQETQETIHTASLKLDSRRLENISDDRVITSRRQHERMDPSCLVSLVQDISGGVMMWQIFSWQTYKLCIIQTTSTTKINYKMCILRPLKVLY